MAQYPYKRLSLSFGLSVRRPDHLFIRNAFAKSYNKTNENLLKQVTRAYRRPN